MSVRLILDASALVAYAEPSSVAPGELILQVEENGDTVGVSAPAFVEAYQRCKPDERSRLTNLLNRPDMQVAILPLTASGLVEMAAVAASGFSLGMVHTAHEAHKVHRCDVLTAERERLECLLDADAILDV
jgi:hypothetical protein